MQLDFLSKIGNFGKNLLLLGERLDRHTSEVKEIRLEIKTLSSAVLDLQSTLGRLEGDLRLMSQRQDHEKQIAEERFENFKLKVGLLIERGQRQVSDEVNDRRKPPRLTE